MLRYWRLFVLCPALALAAWGCGTSDDCAPGSDWPNRNMCDDESPGNEDDDDKGDDDGQTPPKGSIDAGTAGRGDGGASFMDAGVHAPSADATADGGDGSVSDGGVSDAGVPFAASDAGFDASQSHRDH